MINAYKPETNEIQLLKLGKAISLTEKMQSKIDEYTTLKELALSNEIETVKSIVTTFKYTIYCEDAQKYMATSDKSYESAFNSLKNLLEEDFFTKGINITKISACGYGSYAWDIDIDYDGIIFVLNIPDIHLLNKENYKYTHKGQYTLGYYTSDYVINIIKTSYSEVAIQDEFSDFNNPEF